MLTMITYYRKLIDETKLIPKEKLMCIAMIWRIDVPGLDEIHQVVLDGISDNMA